MIRDQGSSWNGNKGYSTTLLPGGVATLAFGIEWKAKRFRVVFECCRDGGRWRKVISKGVSGLPLSRCPSWMASWLRKNGFVDGWLHRDYESPWILNERPAS